jgi:anti-sigma B factor antagonist
VEFTVATAEHGDRKVVTATGELDAHSAPTLQGQLDPLTAVAGASVVVDLSGVGFIDSTGLGVLVSTLKHVREVNGRLDVVVSSPRVLKVLTLTGLNAVIPLHSTLDEALSSGSPR